MIMQQYLLDFQKNYISGIPGFMSEYRYKSTQKITRNIKLFGGKVKGLELCFEKTHTCVGMESFKTLHYVFLFPSNIIAYHPNGLILNYEAVPGLQKVN